MNFVFFIPDEMRAESVSCYGHPLVSMPNYDRLAAEGTRFEQCHVQHSVCSPSRCSLMTGWYPHVAGHRTLWHLLRPHEPSLFRYLKEAGYHIEWYGKNDLYAAASFATAVDHFADFEGGHAGSNLFRPDEPGYYSFLYEPFPGQPVETGDMRRVQAGIDFLRNHARQTEPFVLYLPLSMPHPPYACPQPFHDRVNPADIPPLRPANLPHKPDYFDLIRRYRRLDEVPDEIFAKIQAVYLGCNSYVDWMLGQLLDALDETGLAENTCLIVTSDHGDWAGDYGLVEKWPSALDDTLTRVPLIIRAPGGTAGHVVHEPVEFFDIMATVLDLAGVEARHTHFAQSLVPQLRGAPGDPDRAVFAEGGYDPHEPHVFEGRANEIIFRDATNIYYPKGRQQQEHPESVCRAVMLRTLDYKLVRRPLGVSELYDLRADPRELRNVYADSSYADIRAQMESGLLDWYIRTADVVPVGEDPRGLPCDNACAGS
ncbi:MAG TPA: sulfatase-like hydrolase/transferase [Anaerolineae bacterium]|nr:sulfatase-like hydrolase/transferase [Anaerolineae bacterium]HQI87718.1 sulfatase-like hydrolase/transferase [Anaerolineae bacterium]